MRPYEIVIIFDAGLDESAIRDVVDKTAEAVRSQDGAPGRADHWGKRRLAYPLAARLEGYYVVLEATMPPGAVSEISRMLSLADEVLRFKVVRIPEAAAGRTKPAAATVAEPTATAS